jgi:hypothetical protein
MTLVRRVLGYAYQQQLSLGFWQTAVSYGLAWAASRFALLSCANKLAKVGFPMYRLTKHARTDMASIFAVQICCGEQIKETGKNGHNCIGQSIGALCLLRNAPEGLIVRMSSSCVKADNQWRGDLPKTNAACCGSPIETEAYLITGNNESRRVFVRERWHARFFTERTLRPSRSIFLYLALSDTQQFFAAPEFFK